MSPLEIPTVETLETGPNPSDHLRDVAEEMSRRQFVARLRKAAAFVAPVVATVALTTPASATQESY
jgi:hypothetical protein